MLSTKHDSAIFESVCATSRYGGGQQASQPWPMENEPRAETAFVTADMSQDHKNLYGGVSEAYWVSSQGVAVRVRPASMKVCVARLVFISLLTY